MKTVLVGLLVAPAVAMAQQPPPQAPGDGGGPAPDAMPPPPPGAENKPAGNDGAPATMQTVTVTGSRPSDDFAPPAPSLDRVGGDLHDVPQSITVITKGLMQSQGATSLTSAIRNVPGVTIGAAEGSQIGNNFNLNGFSARTDVYLDGMRDSGQYYRDVFALDEIEVLMGPSSMLFGRGSTGGVINQVFKKPKLNEFTDYSVSGTTNGLVRGTADIDRKTSDTSALRVAMMFQEGAASTVHQTNVLDLGVAPSYKFGIGTPTEITLYGLLQHNHDQVPYGVPPVNAFPANVNPNNAYGFDDDHTDQSIVFFGARIDHAFNKDLKLRNQTQVNYIETDVRETAPHSVGIVGPKGFVATPQTNLPLNQLFVEQQSHDRDIFDWSIYNQTELRAKFDTGPLGHDLLAGVELGYESYYNQNYFRNGTCNGFSLGTSTSGFVGCTSLISPWGGNSPGNVPEQVGNLATATANSGAAYFNDTIQIDPMFKVVGGFRYDIYEAQIGNTINVLNTPGNTTLASATQTTTYPSVRAGVIFQPNKALTYYLSYSTSFNPSLEQLVSTTGTSQPLPPETNEAYEGGFKYDLLEGNLSLTGALFQITQNNSRSQNSDGTFSPTGLIQVKGIRTGVTGRLTDAWQVFGGWTYLDGKILNGIGTGTTGMVPLNTPPNSATLWTTYTIAQKYELGGGVTYIGYRYANNTDSVIAPAFTRFDLTAAYKQPTYDVRLNIFNLFNVTYYEQVIASDGGRTVPGSGFTAMLTYNHHI